MILTLKTKCLLAYCYELLTQAETDTEQGKGNAIFHENNNAEFLRECGFKMVDYCVKNGATKNYLELLSRKHYDLYLLSKAYYGIIIKKYCEHIADVNESHIPILFAILMFQELKVNGLIGLDIDYNKMIDIVYKTDYFKGEQKVSKYDNKTIVYDRSEINKYAKCIQDTVSSVIKHKVASSKKKIKK